MKTLSRITDCALGHLGLFLIGAISWTADRLSTSGSGSEAPTRGARSGALGPAAPAGPA